MSWEVSFTRNKNSSEVFIFNKDYNLNEPTYKLSGNTPEEAVEDAIAYIKEVYECNCFEVKRTLSGLEIREQGEQEPFETYENFQAKKKYTLIDSHGNPFESDVPANFGGHRKLKIYGRLDCPSALRHIAKGQYIQHRVFFADEETALAAGYRPCGICMKEAYKKWKEKQETKRKI